MNKKTSLSANIGKILANVQSCFDDVVFWCFRKIKTSSEKIEEKYPPKDFKEKSFNVLKKLANFFGELGSSFYENYEKLKAEKFNKDK